MSVGGFAALAVAAYLLPVAVLFTVRARPQRTLWDIALAVPCAVALDLLGILLLTLVVRLELAVLVSRATWLVVGAALVTRARGQWGWPRVLGWREVGALAIAASLAAAAVSPISGKFFIWDSDWHTSVVGALPGQKLPFVNALSEREVFHYHFAGDVLAATIKVLSLHVLSANRALAVAHDVMFALTAATVALLMLAVRALRGWPVALGGFVVLFHGPIPLHEGLGHTFFGYAYYPFLNLSYRPHYALSVLLLVGIMGGLLARTQARVGPPEPVMVPALMACVTLLAITDESSLALVGLGLGVVWLLYPRAIASDRLLALMVLLALPLLMAGANLLFKASFSPGSPVQQITLSPQWRVGSVDRDSLLLATADGRKALMIDVLPLVLAWLALLLHAARRRSRADLAMALGGGLVAVAGTLLSLRVEINGDAKEVHRFFVAPFVWLTATCVVVVGRMAPGGTARGLMFLGTVLPVVSTLYWTHQVAPSFLKPYSLSESDTLNMFVTNCRVVTGARLGQKPRRAYVDPAQFYRYVGCRGTFSPGRGGGPWTTKIYPVTDWNAQLRGLEDALDDQSQPVDAVCLGLEVQADPVCRYALASARGCAREGRDFVRCPLTAEDRAAVRAQK